MQLNARATSLNFEQNKVTIELINQYKKIVQKKWYLLVEQGDPEQQF